MWYADQNYTPEEIHVLKELEYDLFMFNPGFRSMWDNNFEDYFKALFDEKAWKEREHRSENRLHNSMDQDPEFRAFLQRQSLIDEVLLGDLDIKNVPIDVQREIEEIRNENEKWNEQSKLMDRLGISELEVEEEKDELFKKANDLREIITEVFSDFYEETKHIDAFRIITNYGQIPAKIYSIIDDLDEDDIDFAWRPDRIGYTLALTSLNRCIESMKNLSDFPQVESTIQESLPLAKEIRQELMDRLENIERLRLKKVQW